MSQSADLLTPAPVSEDHQGPPRLAWMALILVIILAIASAIGVFVAFKIMSDNSDLKKARSITISYSVKNKMQTKVHTVTDPQEVQAILATLDILDTHGGYYFGLSGPSVTFTLPNGTVTRCVLFSQNQMSRDDHGMIQISGRFHQKLSQVLSEVEGRKIDVLGNN